MEPDDTSSNISEVTSDSEIVNSQPQEVAGLISDFPRFADLLPEAAQPYWQLVQQHPLIEAAVILFLFSLLAYLIRRYAINLIQRLASKTKTALDDDIVNAVKVPIFATAIWIGINTAFNSLGIAANWSKYVNPVIITIIIIIWMRVGSALSSTVFTTMSRSQNSFKK